MRNRFIIQYNYGSSIFLFFLLGFIVYLFYNHPIQMMFGIIISIVLIYLTIRETPYVELTEDFLLIQYFPLPPSSKIIYKIEDIEKIEFYNNPKKLRYHNACLYIKSKNSIKVEKHYLALTNEGGKKMIKKFKDIGVDITEISLNKV